jgi:hypothetical protein
MNRVASATEAPRGSFRQLLLRFAGLAAGLALTAVVLRSLGWAQVAEVVRVSAPWIPLVVVLEVGITATDLAAARILAGGGIRPRTWLRSSALAYATCAVLPAGRMAGEAARASVLKADVGLARAAAACARVQTAALVGTAFISLVGALAALGNSVVLTGALLANAILCTALAGAVLFAIRWTWLAKLLPQVGAAIPRAATVKASLACMGGRVIQACQYAVVLGAVGGAVTPRGALIVQGVHIVGATIGDAVPNQLGITDAAYRVFANALDLEPARAVSIALAIRVAQLGLAAVAWFVALATRPAA